MTDTDSNKSKNDKRKGKPRQAISLSKLSYNEKIIQVKRVTKVVKGG